MKQIKSRHLFGLLALLFSTDVFAFAMGLPLNDPGARLAGVSSQSIVFSQVTGTYDGVSSTELDPNTQLPITPTADLANADVGVPGSTIWVTGAFSSAMAAGTCPSSSAGKVALTSYHYQTRKGAGTTVTRKSEAMSKVEDRMITECKRDALLAMSSNGSLKFVVTLITPYSGASFPVPSSLCSFDLSYFHDVSCGVCATGTPGC